MMRFAPTLLAAAVASCVLASGPSLHAEPRANEPRLQATPIPAPDPEAGRKSSLDDLFARLAAAQDEEEAKGVAALIERRLARSGSDTADLLMQRSVAALEADDAPLAVELLDRVTQLKPDWAEAWNRRAIAFFKLDDPGRAILDLQEALVREPRAFDAWTALGHLEMASGDKVLALAAYRHALAIHPFLTEVKQAVERLAPEVEGRDL